MKIVVLGATGTTGALVLHEALDVGHELVALVRRPEAVAARDALTATCGSVEDLASLRAAFAGADAVISCLGARMTPRCQSYLSRTSRKSSSASPQTGISPRSDCS